jgi:hypothetical protein
MSFTTINLCVATQRVFIVVSVYFFINSVWKLLDTPSYSGNGSVSPRILNIGTRCRRMFSFTPRLFYPRGKTPCTHWIRGWVGKIPVCAKSRDSSVGIVLGYGLDDRGSRVRFPARAGNFSLHRRVQNVSGAHPASYPVGTRGSFPGDKAAGA